MSLARLASASLGSANCRDSRLATMARPLPRWSRASAAPLDLPANPRDQIYEPYARGVHKLSRVPDPLDLQEHRVSAPHALDDRQRPLHSLIHDRDPIEPADADTVSEPHGFACAW